MPIATSPISLREATVPTTSFKSRGTHGEGTTWNIPEHELDKALATYRRQDGTFKHRIKKAAMYLTAEDAEAIIRLATYGIVRLNLVPQPVHTPSKPYYL